MQHRQAPKPQAMVFSRDASQLIFLSLCDLRNCLHHWLRAAGNNKIKRELFLAEKAVLGHKSFFAE